MEHQASLSLDATVRSQDSNNSNDSKESKETTSGPESCLESKHSKDVLIGNESPRNHQNSRDHHEMTMEHRITSPNGIEAENIPKTLMYASCGQLLLGKK